MRMKKVLQPPDVVTFGTKTNSADLDQIQTAYNCMNSRIKKKNTIYHTTPLKFEMDL